MQTKSVIVGVTIGVVLVVGPLGAMAAVDELNGPDTPVVSVERLNSTHGAVAWTTEEPGYGHLTTYVQPECDSSWIAVNHVNDSSLNRSHHVVASIYELNETKANRTLSDLSEEHEIDYDGDPPERFKVVAAVQKDGSGASQTVVQRDLGGNCQ